jgi:radical SAM protein with 4Fe4S-binding SPASM domain
MNIRTVYVEITNQCNLNCRTCYNRSGLNREHREISKEQLKSIIGLFLPYGLKRFLISGGEPTLHSEFDAILDLLDEYPQISFGIVTNGTKQNPKLIDMFNSGRSLTLQISLDGSNEEEDAKTRGAGHFGEAVEFVKKIHNPAVAPLLKMVISQSNFNNIEDFYKLACSLGCVPEYAFIYKSGNGAEDWESKTLAARQKLKAIELIDRLNIEFNAEAYLPLCTSGCPYAGSLENLSLCIKTDGSIQPCQMIYDNAYSIGNVFSFNQKEFLGKLGYISSIARERAGKDFGCGKCLIRGCCGKGCMAEAVNLHGDPLSDDGGCDFRKLQFIGHDLKEVMNRVSEG